MKVLQRDAHAQSGLRVTCAVIELNYTSGPTKMASDPDGLKNIDQNRAVCVTI